MPQPDPEERPAACTQGNLRHKAIRWWHHCQIGHRSEYSVERLLAFRDYYHRTSLTRAAAVCILSPIPAVLVTLAIDCIPLRPPSEGWQANYAVWVRLLIAIFVEALGVAFQVKAVIVPGAISTLGAVKIALGTTTSSVLVTMLLAALWKFPIPFGYVLMLNLYVTFFIVFMILVIGPGLLTQSATLRQQIKSELLIMASQGTVAVLYPGFSAVFNRLSGVEQTVFVLLMPLIKFLTKQSIVHVAGSFYEYVGPILVFSVDLFNIYYVAICMQTSKSLATTLIIMAMDGFHIILALRTIFYRTKRSRRIEPVGPEINPLKHYLRDLPSQLRKVFQQIDPSHPCGRRIRLLAPFPLPLSNESRTFMNELARTNSFANDTARCSTDTAIIRSPVGPPSSRNLTAVSTTQRSGTAPALSVIPCETKSPTSAPPLRDVSVTDLTEVSSIHVGEESILDALQALFHSEYVLLAEYVEFIVPMLYSFYLVVLFHLPVSAYYPHTATMTADKLKLTVTNIMIYAALEWVSFALLLVALKRKFGYSPLYQLAFVLEAQASAIQGHLFLWTISILHITLVHYGADFIVQDI